MAASQIAAIPVPQYPPEEIRNSLPAHQWQQFLEIWDSLCKSYLQLPPETFQSMLDNSEHISMLEFLTSYMEYHAIAGQKTLSFDSNNRAPYSLHRTVYLLLHKILTRSGNLPDLLCSWSFLGNCSQVYRHATKIGSLIEKGWADNRSRLDASIQKYKVTLTRRIETGKISKSDVAQISHCLLPLIRTCPSAGMYLLAGSDLLDSILSAYPKAEASWEPKLLLLIYLMLLSPLQAEKSNRSLLYDHLYTIKENADKHLQDDASSHILLGDLVTETPFMSKATKLIEGKPDVSRIQNLLQSFQKYKRAQRSRPRTSRKTRTAEEKIGAMNGYGHGEIYSGIDVHRMSLISQIQDLFLDLGSGFIVRLLDEYNNDVEVITAHLLEDTLPPALDSLDRTEQLPQTQTNGPVADLVPELIPRATPPPSPPHPAQRRNVHDDDDFDRLAVSTSQLYFGRKDTDNTTFAQDASARSNSKAAIMSALAAFDADDDERDDTYDIEDVGGTVDAAGPEGDEEANINDLREKNEEALWSAWKMDPRLFERNSSTRKSSQRDSLRSETGMTDEAVEGWAIMLQKDPRKLKRLEAKYSSFSGGQAQLGRTAYRKMLDENLGTESDTDGVSSGGETSRVGRGGVRRGRGGGRGRGGNVGGPSSDKDTQIGRQRKEASKSSRANHNRRDQRAKKMARGGFPG